MLTSVLSCTASVLFVKRKFYADTQVKIMLLWKSCNPKAKVSFHDTLQRLTHLLWSLRKFNLFIFGKGKSSTQGWG